MFSKCDVIFSLIFTYANQTILSITPGCWCQIQHNTSKEVLSLRVQFNL